MNQWMWGFALVLGLLLLWAVFRLGAAERVPEPSYRRVALMDKGVEIREYPALAIAKTPMRDASLGSSANEGFRRVARYLFGGNRSKESMAMTAPVTGDCPAEGSESASARKSAASEVDRQFSEPSLAGSRSLKSW